MLKRNLKPCPLCGSKHIEHDFDEYIRNGSIGIVYRIHCEDCGVELNEVGMSCSDRAVKKWNRRAGEEAEGRIKS